MEPRHASLLKVQMFNNKICAYKEGSPSPVMPSFLMLSAQPFSSNSPDSQVVVNSGKSWRTSSASRQMAGSVTSKETSRVEKQHSRWPHLSGIWSEPACLGCRRLHTGILLSY